MMLNRIIQDSTYCPRYLTRNIWAMLAGHIQGASLSTLQVDTRNSLPGLCVQMWNWSRKSLVPDIQKFIKYVNA
jgi:hypothetical protein